MHGVEPMPELRATLKGPVLHAICTGVASWAGLFPLTTKLPMRFVLLVSSCRHAVCNYAVFVILNSSLYTAAARRAGCRTPLHRHRRPEVLGFSPAARRESACESRKFD